MSQHTQQIRANYVLAGDHVHSFERIVVSGHVDIPDAFLHHEDIRVAYKASREQESKRFGVSLPWALLMIMLAIVIMGSISLSTVHQTATLKDEIAQLQNKYTAFERERLVLDEQLSEAKDSNFICYYASQNLGMKLALHEETIQVTASNAGSSGFGRSAADTGMSLGRR